jgi:hypothetical protein
MDPSVRVAVLTLVTQAALARAPLVQVAARAVRAGTIPILLIPVVSAVVVVQAKAGTVEVAGFLVAALVVAVIMVAVAAVAQIKMAVAADRRGSILQLLALRILPVQGVVMVKRSCPITHKFVIALSGGYNSN